MPKRLTKIQKQNIIQLYFAGKTPTEISKIYNIYSNSVNRIIRNSGGQANQAKKKTSKEQELIIIERYNAGESSESIAKSLALNGTTICRILKRNDIIIRPSIENKRKYKINETFFEFIDTPEKAYFLGWLYSDGNVSKEKNDIKIEIKQEDDDILKKLSQLIYYKEHIHYYMNQDCFVAALRITSQKIRQDLNNLGCVPNKTFIIRYPNINESLDSHFIRGYFDGDGCFSISKTERGTFDITSNVNFIKDLSNKIMQHLNIDANIYINNINSNTAYLQIRNKNELCKVYNFLYKDTSLYLERKKSKFEQHLQFINIKKNKFNKDYTIKYWFDYFRSRGFPYPNYTDNILINDWQKLKSIDPAAIENNNILSNTKAAGIKLFRHFNPHFYSIYSNKTISMLDAFNDDNILMATIKNRIEQNYSLSNNMLLQGLRNGYFAFAPSIFNPTIAKFIYEKYCKNNDIVYDYSFGFGQRMLASLSIEKNITYIGCDPLKNNFHSVSKMINFLSTYQPEIKNKVQLICDGSENYCSDLSIDLAFSSPPYFNKELYANENSQAYYNGYKYFINNWWRRVCNNVKNMLNQDGYFVLNMTERVEKYDILNDMLNVCYQYGFIEIERLFIKLSRNIRFRNKGEIKLEPIIIMKKR